MQCDDVCRRRVDRGHSCGRNIEPRLDANPVRDWNVVYLPYCDGSLFAGDVDVDTNDDGTVDRYQHGLQNLSAALDLAVSKFSQPKTVVVAGSSAGGFGTIAAAPLARIVYPKSELFVVNDGGVGIARGNHPEFVSDLLNEWNANELIPASCVDCLSNGHLTRLVKWQLDRDPRMTVAVISSFNDFVIATMFMQVSDSDFAKWLVEATNEITLVFPDRYKRYYYGGTKHTVLALDSSVVDGESGSGPLPSDLPAWLARVFLADFDVTLTDQISPAQWVAAMLNNEPQVWHDTEL
ncbi:MAG: pectin acetylesterase-family hydrolase [Polyangiales bacterium]